MEPTEKGAASTPTDSPDDNLIELLDSCIDDFNKPIPKLASTESKSAITSAAKPKPTSCQDASAPESASAAWSSEFKEFSNVMENFIGDESEMEEIRKLMEGCLSQNPVLEDENFADSFADTIRQLTEQAQNVPSDASPEDLANLLGGLGVGEDGEAGLESMPELMPLMQGVMQKLMSKELLYPSLKEIVDKYPAWLSEHRPTLDTQEYEKYESQCELMKQICEEFERDCSESEEDKKAQFERVLQLMQRIQSFGNPPKELVSDIGPGIPMDDQGNLQIPGMPGNCVVM